MARGRERERVGERTNEPACTREDGTDGKGERSDGGETEEWGKEGGLEIAHERESGSEIGIELKGKRRASESAPRRKRRADDCLRNEEMGRREHVRFKESERGGNLRRGA